MVNLLPLNEGEWITTVLPLPEDETSWNQFQVVFGTTSGSVRRNELSDFTNINRNGKIAMKLPKGEGIVGVQLCTENDDVLLTTRGGKCIRFRVTDIRVFKGRESMGVRGIKLAAGDKVVTLALLVHSDATPAEARTYLRQAGAARRAATGEVISEDTETVMDDETEEIGEVTALTPERYAALGAAEQFILTVSEQGFGKRTSSYEYRVTGRGGSGIVAMALTGRNSALTGAFPVEESDDIMLITNTGQTIRCPVADIGIKGRSTQGVTLFRLEADKRVVFVDRVAESENGNGHEE
jgi:DNA gyrase subunit A